MRRLCSYTVPNPHLKAVGCFSALIIPLKRLVAGASIQAISRRTAPLTASPLPQDSYFELDGLRLHYVDWGNEEAQPLVLLHGLQDCARSWDTFATWASARFRVVALDHRGHGDSDWAPADRYRFQDYVSDVEGLVQHLDLDDIVLMGHSAGGRNAFLHALSQPQAVRSLIIVDIDPDEVNPASRQMFERYRTEGDEWESMEAVVERLRNRQPNSADEMLLRQAMHMTKALDDGRRVWKRDPALITAYERPDLWTEWSRLSCPTLIIRGRQSELLSHEVAVRMREALPGSRLAELEGGGHWFYQEFPGAFEKTVRWFLDGL